MASTQLNDLICFGELLWDLLPSGKVAGGAPFNIVNRANSLGLASVLISSVGKDDLGDELSKLVKDKGNTTTFIQSHKELSTGVVNIKVGLSGEPSYEILYPVAWDDIIVDDRIRELVSNARSLVYSSLGLRDQRSREALFSLLPHAQLKICDINLREGHYQKSTIMRMIEHADILRMNEFELAMVAEWHGLGSFQNRSQMQQLLKQYNFKCIIATMGEEGAVCLQKDEWYSQPVFKVDIKDTVGAGDAFLASFIYKYLHNRPIRECLKFGCVVGALTASKHGGTPEITGEEIEQMMGSV